MTNCARGGGGGGGGGDRRGESTRDRYFFKGALAEPSHPEVKF